MNWKNYFEKAKKKIEIFSKNPKINEYIKKTDNYIDKEKLNNFYQKSKFKLDNFHKKLREEKRTNNLNQNQNFNNYQQNNQQQFDIKKEFQNLKYNSNFVLNNFKSYMKNFQNSNQNNFQNDNKNNNQNNNQNNYQNNFQNNYQNLNKNFSIDKIKNIFRDNNFKGKIKNNDFRKIFNGEKKFKIKFFYKAMLIGGFITFCYSFGKYTAIGRANNKQVESLLEFQKNFMNKQINENN